MKKTTILFDLDGTLLPLSEELFGKYYFGAMQKHFDALGHSGANIVSAVWHGTKVMRTNTGQHSNEEAFWKDFLQVLPQFDRTIEEEFLQFYQTDFDLVKLSTTPSSISNQIIKTALAKGYRIALATNPLFPVIATKKRILWAGLDENDFEVITTYETSKYSKPSLEYYLEVTKKLNVKPEECIMVGNDVEEDGISQTIGMDFFLITGCMNNAKNLDITQLKKGSLEDCLAFVSSLPSPKE